MAVCLRAPETLQGMVVDDSDRLHPGVDDSGTDEFEPPPLQIL